MDEGRPKIKLDIDAESISKLVKDPVEVDFVEYGLTAELNDMEEKESFKAWLHRITWVERTHINAASGKLAIALRNMGEDDKETVHMAVSGMIARMTVFYSLKVGKDAKAERFFKSKEEFMQYPIENGIFQLYGRYLQEFQLTEIEWGNWLRARNLGISSALPGKQGEVLSAPSSQN